MLMMRDEDFIKLCKIGTAQQVAHAMENGANVNAKDNDGNTALIWAARNNENPEVIAALIKAGADINAKNKNGNTALIWAARNNEKPEVIATLIKAGANIDAKNKNGNTALIWAARNNKNPEVIATLIKADANIDAKNKNGNTALIWAARNNKNPEVIATLIKASADINTKDNTVWTTLGNTLTYAVKYYIKNPDFIATSIATLIKVVADIVDINVQDNDYWTELKDAAKNNNNSEVLYTVGMILATGDGVEEDQWEAVECFRAAAKKGHKAARNELAKRGIYN
ncbi:MAG: ankyrin repeat domain-containing protein [Synergistaceae bacterium]|nr:ankyrin repeat domain-containing protein [Synergistaceae bacterium]